MAVFTWKPDWSVEKNRKPEKTSIQFGDGYTQHKGVGANKIRKPHSMDFSGSFAKIWEIEQFLEARNGVEDFYWTTPDGDTLLFYCENWTVDYSTYNNITLSTEFKQR